MNNDLHFSQFLTDELMSYRDSSPKNEILLLKMKSKMLVNFFSLIRTVNRILAEAVVLGDS